MLKVYFSAPVDTYQTGEGREGKAMLRDSPVGQYGIKTVGDQGFQSMGEIPSLTLEHAVQ